MKKSFRYKGKITGLGVHSEFFKKNLIGNTSWRGTLNLPKPQNKAEIAMLSKFIFGTELSVRFEYCFDEFAKAVQEAKHRNNTQFARYLKLIQLDPNSKDYISKAAAQGYSRLMSREGKMVLVYFRYWCEQKHLILVMRLILISGGIVLVNYLVVVLLVLHMDKLRSLHLKKEIEL